MPDYKYVCKTDHCKNKFHKRQKINDPKPVCPQCKGEVDVLIQASTFVLKGNGWFNSGGY